MTGQTNIPPSSPARARDRRSGPRVTRLPDKIAVACPAGTRSAVVAAAESDGMAPADWLRKLVRNGLDAARKRRERAAAKGKN